MSGPSSLVAIDGRDAVAGVIIRPNASAPSGLAVEAYVNGISKQGAAYFLRHVADLWDPPTTTEGGDA